MTRVASSFRNYCPHHRGRYMLLDENSESIELFCSDVDCGYRRIYDLTWVLDPKEAVATCQP